MAARHIRALRASRRCGAIIALSRHVQILAA
jgi:hypothetical protein